MPTLYLRADDTMRRLMNQAISEVAPNGYWIDGFFGDSREQDPQTLVDRCRFRAQHGKGDQAPPSLLPDSVASRAA